MRFSKITIFYIILFLVMSIYSLLSLQTPILNTSVTKDDEKAPLIQVMTGETITIQVSGNDVILAITTGRRYNGSFQSIYNLKSGDVIEMYFSEFDIVTFQLMSQEPAILTVRSKGLSTETTSSLTLISIFVIISLSIEILVRKQQLSFPIISNEIESISLTSLTIILIILWQIMRLQGGQFLDFTSIELQQRAMFHGMVTSMFPIVFFLLILLPVRRAIFQRERMMYKTYPINPLKSYIARGLVYLFLFLPLGGITFTHLMFARGSTLVNMDNFLIRYIIPTIIAIVSVFYYLLLSIFFEDLSNLKWVTIVVTPVIYILGYYGVLQFYPFYIINANLGPEINFQTFSSTSEIFAVSVSSALILISVNIALRKSRRYMEK